MQENTRRRDDRTTKNAGAIRLFKVTAYKRFLGFTGGGFSEVAGRANVDPPLRRLREGRARRCKLSNSPDLQVVVVVVVTINKFEGGDIGLWSESQMKLSQGSKNPGPFKSWPGPPLVCSLGIPSTREAEEGGGGGVTITPTMYSNLSHRMCPGTTASTVVGSALGRSYLACKLRGCGMGL